MATASWSGEWRSTAFGPRLRPFLNDRWPLIALTMVLTVSGIYYVAVKGENRSAINRWRPQVRQLWTGEDIYLKYGFPSPPIMAILLTPFCAAEGKGTMAAWFLVKAVGVVWAASQLLAVMRERGIGFPSWVAALALVLSLRPILGDLQHGNVNLVIMVITLAAVLAYRRGHDVSAGLLLSLAISCRMTPALIGVYFLWKREWKLTAVILVGIVLWSLVVPAALLGWDRNITLWSHWADYMVWPVVQEGRVDTEQVNQSAMALLYRFITPAVAIESTSSWNEVSLNFLQWSPDSAQAVGLGMVVFFLASLGWWCRKRIHDRRSLDLWIELGVVMLVMLLLNERSWKHHFVWLLPIYVTLFAVASLAWANRETRARALSIWILIGLASALIGLTSQDLVRPFIGTIGAKMVQAWGAYVWASILLIVALVLARLEVQVSGD